MLEQRAVGGVHNAARQQHPLDHCVSLVYHRLPLDNAGGHHLSVANRFQIGWLRLIRWVLGGDALADINMGNAALQIDRQPGQLRQRLNCLQLNIPQRKSGACGSHLDPQICHGRFDMGGGHLAVAPYINGPDVMGEDLQQQDIQRQPHRQPLSLPIAAGLERHPVPRGQPQPHPTAACQWSQTAVLPGVTSSQQRNILPPRMKQRNMFARGQIQKPFGKAALRLPFHPSQQKMHQIYQKHGAPP